MKIEQLQQLLTIVEYGSINKAAQNLYLTHSTLSTSIRNLENELGGRIFERTGHGVILTSFGNEVYQHAKTINAQVRFLQQCAKRQSTNNSGISLHISNMYCQAANSCFIKIYNQYRNRVYSMSINERSTEEVINNVFSGVADIGVLALFSNYKEMYLRLLEYRAITYHKFSERQLYVLVGPNNPLYDSEVDYLSPEQLVGYPFCTYHDIVCEPFWQKFHTDEDGNKDISVGSMECLMEIIANTDVFSIEVCSSYYLKTNPYCKTIRFIPLIGEDFICEYGWICQQDKQLSIVAEKYVKELEKFEMLT